MESHYKHHPHYQPVAPQHVAPSYSHPQAAAASYPYMIDQVVVQENINISDYEPVHHHPVHHAMPVHRHCTNLAVILVLFILLVIVLRARNMIL